MSYFYVDGSEERYATFGEARMVGGSIWMVITSRLCPLKVQVWDPDRWDDTATPEDILSDLL